MEVEEHLLKSKWVLWFHKVDDENWKEDSYIKVYDIETYEDILFVIQEIPNITSGMFFLMKKGIFPTYEDPENQNGGYWSLRITKKDSFDMWQKLLYYICVDRITKDEKKNEQINGFTISPKINNCIFKIWTKNYKSMKGDNLRGDIEGINPADTFYLQHRADN
jgi:translation initiation factor 4E